MYSHLIGLIHGSCIKPEPGSPHPQANWDSPTCLMGPIVAKSRHNRVCWLRLLMAHFPLIITNAHCKTFATVFFCNKNQGFIFKIYSALRSLIQVLCHRFFICSMFICINFLIWNNIPQFTSQDLSGIMFHDSSGIIQQYVTIYPWFRNNHTKDYFITMLHLEYFNKVAAPPTSQT